MKVEEITKYLLENYQGIVMKQTWGETSFFYNPDGSKPHGAYFLTIKEQDGENDRASGLFREGVFRINFCITKELFLKFFDEKPKRPAKGQCIQGNYDFMSLNKLLPHPVYGWMNWVAILNPDNREFEKIRPLISVSFDKAVKKFNSV